MIFNMNLGEGGILTEVRQDALQKVCHYEMTIYARKRNKQANRKIGKRDKTYRQTLYRDMQPKYEVITIY